MLEAALLSLAVASAPAAAPLSVADLRMSAPEEWLSKPSSSSMRVAQYEVPGKAGAAEAVVYYFGAGQGGSVDDNVARWFGQFTPDAGAKDIASVREKREAGEAKVTVVRARGVYQSGMPMGPKTPKPGHALYGIIIESPQGPVFVKLTGPAATVDAAAAGCEALIKSIRLGGK